MFPFDGCNRKFTIVFDCLHRIVIMKAFGNHVEKCYERNKEIGYRVFKNILIIINQNLKYLMQLRINIIKIWRLFMKLDHFQKEVLFILGLRREV